MGATEPTFNFTDSLSRLRDDEDLLADKKPLLKKMQDHMSQAITRLCMKPERGGNPFVFVCLSDKMHYLRSELGGRDFRTAATDSVAYYWSPDFMEALSGQDVAHTMTICRHEVYHNVFFHTLEERRAGRRRDVWAVVIDYMVNATIEKEEIEVSKVSKRDIKNLWKIQLPWPDPEKGDRDKNGDLFTKTMTPCSISTYLKYIDGSLESIPEPLVYTDLTALDYSLDSLYDLIIQAMKKSPRRCKESNGGCGALSMDPKTGKPVNPGPYPPEACQKCGAMPGDDGFGTDDGGSGLPKGGFDSHDLPSKKTKQQISDETVRAAEAARSISRGTLPAGIEALLGELDEPELQPRDLMVNALHRRVMDEGMNNDWTRMRRRPTYLYRSDPKTGKVTRGPRLWRPKTYELFPRWLAAVDTSGSMSDADIADGVKELKIVASSVGACEGTMVPMDSKPYWDQAVKIESDADLKRFKPVGRGGTVFHDFFKELPDHYTELDMVVVITDGYIDNIPKEFAPPCQVIWVVVNNENFVPPFGRVCTLRQKGRPF